MASRKVRVIQNIIIILGKATAWWPEAKSLEYSIKMYGKCPTLMLTILDPRGKKQNQTFSIKFFNSPQKCPES